MLDLFERREVDGSYAYSATERKEHVESISLVEGGQPSFYAENNPILFLNNLLKQSYIQACLLSCVAKTQNAFLSPVHSGRTYIIMPKCHIQVNHTMW